MQSTCRQTPVAEPIAIVGLSCKFAGTASTPEGFWQMLAAGRSAWSEIPPSRFNLTGSYHRKVDLLSTANVRGGHFLEQDISLFDATFFNLSAEAAASLDPQIRLQLETVYEALENGGITLASIAGTRTAVYAAVHTRDYREGIIRDEDNLPRLLPTGTGDAMFSNRVSHFYDLRGPSFTLDTGCSGGLVAMHQGIQSLRTGEADAAVICGSLICLNPDMFKILGSIGFASPDGKSYAFDSRANGYGRGEGTATVILKRLSDAIEAGDPIRAVIRESGLNQDGKTETITTPSQNAQVMLMQDCYRRAGLDPLHTQYCEAHGTGTMAGDPIECGALATVFKQGRSPDNPLLIGSVKTNIGHTEPASGLAALIKVVLALEQKKIPQSVNFEKPNPRLPLEEWRLRVVTELQDWPVGPGGVRRASINNFGYGGTNGHLIVENAPEKVSAGQVNGDSEPQSSLNTQILVLSAQSEQGCRDMVTNLKRYLDRYSVDERDDLLQSIIHTLGQRRTRFPWVFAQAIPTEQGLRGVSLALNSSKVSPQRAEGVPRVGMFFTGQGAQWYAMGRELIAAYPVFESSLREADTYLKSLGADWSVIEELSKKEEVSHVHEVGFSTPLCVAVQISLARLLRSWGIKPVAVTSHSSGEIAAAYVVGGLDYRSAMTVAYYRAILAADKTLQSPVKGGMVAVGLGVEQTIELLGQLNPDNGFVVVACVNSPSSTTVSGDDKALVELESLAKDQRIVARRVKVETAFHSHHMQAIANHYLRSLQGRLSAAEDDERKSPIAFSSPVTGCRLSSVSQLSEPAYWVDSLVEPVQFINALTDMVIGQASTSACNVDVIIEVGPHKAFKFPIEEILAEPEFPSPKPSYLSCLVRNTDAVESIHALASGLMMRGFPIDLDAVNFPHGRPSSVHVLLNLPSYPWNHQHRHWCESRFNRALRARSQPPHSLLGSLVLGTDLNNPSWRHILRIRDTPWLAEHVIQNNIVFPAAGYMSLAIEAIRQLSDLQSGNSHVVSGYLLRDINILQALVIPDTDEGVEVQTQLSNVSEQAIGYRGYKEFQIFSVTPENQWTAHARGLITVEHEDTPGKTIPQPRPFNLSGYRRQFAGSDLYADVKSKGLTYGKAFKAITEVEQAGDHQRADSKLIIPDTNLPTDIPYQSLVHPTTLDAAIHSTFTPLLDVAGNENGMVPRSLGSLWVSSAISQRAGHQFKVFTSLRYADARTWHTDIILADHDDISAPTVLEMQDVLFQSLGRNTVDQQVDREWEKNPCFKTTWAPDFSLLSNKVHARMQQQLSHQLAGGEMQVQLDIRRVCLYFMSETLASLTPDDLQQLQGHHVKFHTWMQQQVQRAADGLLGSDSADWLKDTPEQRQTLMAKVRNATMNGEIVCHVGPLLPAIFRQERAPLEVLMEEDRLNRYYHYGLKVERAASQAADVFETLIHKNPGARILEIGGGTGSLTRYTLPKIGSPSAGEALAELYHFTDISTAFFDGARKQFSPWSEVMRFDKLDIEANPASQGFELASYDIVIAAQVLHATKSMVNTMTHVRQLMKPGATLLLLETTQDAMDSHFIFGLLPGWWLGEEPERALTPTMSLGLWDKTLHEAGFSGIEFDVRDCESDEWYRMNVMTATAGLVPQPMVPTSDSIILVTRKLAYCEQRWVKALAANLMLSKQVPATVEFETATAESYQNKWVVFLGEIEHPLLHSLDAAGLNYIQTMFKHSRGILWVTRGGAVDCKRPELSLASGFLRSIRQEYVGRKYITLDVDPNSKPCSDTSVAAITQVLTTGFGAIEGEGLSSPPYEFEYAERNGVILIPRLFRDNVRNQSLFPKAVDWSAPTSLTKESFFQSGRPLALKVGVPGLLDTLAYDDDPRLAQEDTRFPLDCIEIKPRAYGVNFRDVLVAMGQLERRVMGVEGAGVITRVGSRAAAHGYSVGDNVFALLPGGFGSRARVEWTDAMHMPPGMSFEQAASIPSVFTTAYLCLYKIARVERGQTVLIHAGAGGVGQAAIQLAQIRGVEVFTTVGSPEKRALVMERYGISADHIFSSRDRSFADGILHATGGRGVDVVLNSLSGTLLQESLNIIAPFGHFVEIGKRDIEQNNHLEMKPFARHITFSSFDLYALYTDQKHLVHSALAELGRLMEESSIAPVSPITTYPLADVGKAFRLIQAGKHSGKVVLTVSPQEIVPVLPRASTAQLRPDASYLLVGGAGGIGRSIAHWLVGRGARNLIVLSRSAETSPSALSLVEELRPMNCHVRLVSCDASSQAGLAAALASCSSELPPIRGVIQGAMVLRDSVLERMTFDDYQTSLSPKVKASWNLHTQLSKADLDFFIFLSSMSGVYGLPSQSNYSAGNAYEDALAHWRVSQGLPAVSLDLGPVKGVGVVAANAGVADRLTRQGHYPVTEEQVLRVLDSAILSPFDKQIAVGINQGPGAHWQVDGALGRDARFKALRYRQNLTTQASTGNTRASAPLASQITIATSKEEVEQIVTEAITIKLAAIFMIPAADIDSTKHLSTYGLDSLGAVELRNMLALQLGAEISIFSIMQSDSLAALASEVSRKSTHVDASLFAT